MGRIKGFNKIAYLGVDNIKVYYKGELDGSGKIEHKTKIEINLSSHNQILFHIFV